MIHYSVSRSWRALAYAFFFDLLSRVSRPTMVCILVSASLLVGMSDLAASPLMVRVLLDEWAVQDVQPDQWVIACADGMRILDDRGRQFGKKKKITIGAFDGTIYMQGKKRTSKKIVCRPLAGKIFFDGQEWDGSLHIILDNETIFCINTVPLKQYLFSVLRTESWPGWPLEVNKAFAIVSRSYAIKKMVEAQGALSIFDIRNTNHHQTYQGSHNVYSLHKAVDQTEGVFLSYNNEPILAMFDSCCGGVIPADIEGLVDFEKAPYLARTYPCTFCKHEKIYRWSTEVPIEQLRDSLTQALGTKIAPIMGLRVISKDKAGVVKEIEILTSRGSHYISCRQLYSMLKGVKSFSFSIARNGKSFIVKGRGFGHHIGLCQWGSRQMVREGWDYRRILNFYYPQVQYMKLSNE
ncbi:MAG: SpoIID/LytB domain-containing protein [Candidatus Babeliales bacterium]